MEENQNEEEVGLDGISQIEEEKEIHKSAKKQAPIVIEEGDVI